MKTIIFKIENQKNFNQILINLIQTTVDKEVELFLNKIKNEKTNEPNYIYVADIAPQKHYNINTIQIYFNIIFDFGFFTETKSFNKVLELSYKNDMDTNEQIKMVLDKIKLDEVKLKEEKKLIELEKEKEKNFLEIQNQRKLEIKEKFLFDFITNNNNSYLLKLKENGFEWIGLASEFYAKTIVNKLDFRFNADGTKIEHQPTEKELNFYINCLTKLNKANDIFSIKSHYFSKIDGELYFEAELKFDVIDKTFYCVKKVIVN